LLRNLNTSYDASRRQQFSSDGDSSVRYANDVENWNDPDRFSNPNRRGNGADGKLTGTLFIFDPNTLDIAGWQKLGVREKTALTIKKYLASGGRFRKADDLLKIYGLSDLDKQRLLPFVRIEAVQQLPPAPGVSGNIAQRNATTSPLAAGRNITGEHRSKQPQRIEINTADSSEWASLPGIGPVLSLRIIRYRDRLGGFYDIQQVAETYGLQDSVFQKIKGYLLCKGAIQQIPLNEVTPDILEKHPYLRRQIARAIIDYRAQHGAFKEITDLKQVIAITPELYQRIVPYLRL
jgi:DNA uptake protein ComE-like DNA-binding protein